VTNPTDISAPCQIICEGAGDEAFFTKLLTSKQITGFQARCARRDKGCIGKSGITDTVAAILGAAELRPGTVKGILIAVDSDDDPMVAFAEAKKFIKSAKPMQPVPDRLLEIKEGNVSVAVMTIPWADQPGNLDTLLFSSMGETHNDMMQPLARYSEGTSHRTEGWSLGKVSKMKLRCIIAASYEPDPSLSLAGIIPSHACPIDFNGIRFDQISEYLRRFRDIVSP